MDYPADRKEKSPVVNTRPLETQVIRVALRAGNGVLVTSFAFTEIANLKASEAASEPVQEQVANGALAAYV